MEKYLTTREFCERTGLSYRVVKQYCREGKLNAYAKGDRWMIPEKMAERYADGKQSVKLDGYVYAYTSIHTTSAYTYILVNQITGKEIIRKTVPYTGTVITGMIFGAEKLILEAGRIKENTGLLLIHVHVRESKIIDMARARYGDYDMHQKFLDNIHRAGFSVRWTMETESKFLEKAEKLSKKAAKSNHVVAPGEVSRLCTKQCYKALSALKKTGEKPSADELIALQVGGSDYFSSLKLDELMAMCDPDVQDYFGRKSDPAETLEKAMRWHLRGLSAIDAYRKVKLSEKRN